MLPGTCCESPQRHLSLFMQQHSAERAVADKQEPLLPSGGLLFLVSHTPWGEVAENQLSCQKRQKSFLWAVWLLYLFILLIYHTLVTSLIFLNLTNRLPRTQSIWLSSANKLFAMCLLSKKTCCPPSYNPEKDSVNMFYQLIIIKKTSCVFLAAIYKMSPEARQWISLLIQLLFLPMQMLLGLLLEGCSKTAGLLAFKLFLYLMGFVLSTKAQIQRSFMDLKSSIFLITSLHWGLKHLHWSKTALKQPFQTRTQRHPWQAECWQAWCCGSWKGALNSPHPGKLEWVKVVK